MKGNVYTFYGWEIILPLETDPDMQPKNIGHGAVSGETHGKNSFDKSNLAVFKRERFIEEGSKAVLSLPDFKGSAGAEGKVAAQRKQNAGMEKQRYIVFFINERNKFQIKSHIRFFYGERGRKPDDIKIFSNGFVRAAV